MKISKDLFGGLKILKKLWEEFIDKLIIMNLQIFKILRSFFKISLKQNFIKLFFLVIPF